MTILLGWPSQNLLSSSSQRSAEYAYSAHAYPVFFGSDAGAQTHISSALLNSLCSQNVPRGLAERTKSLEEASALQSGCWAILPSVIRHFKAK